MLLQALCSILYPLVKSNWSYSPETPNLGQIRRFLESCDLEIWQMTFKNNRAPLLCYFKLCAAFHSHWWMTSPKQHQAICIISPSYANSNWSYSPETVKLGRDLCDLDLWPWPFAWTLPWFLVITPENFTWYDDGNIVKKVWQTDRRMDRKYHSQSCLVAAKKTGPSVVTFPFTTFHYFSCLLYFSCFLLCLPLHFLLFPTKMLTNLQPVEQIRLWAFLSKLEYYYTSTMDNCPLCLKKYRIIPGSHVNYMSLYIMCNISHYQSNTPSTLKKILTYGFVNNASLSPYIM